MNKENVMEIQYVQTFQDMHGNNQIVINVCKIVMEIK